MNQENHQKEINMQREIMGRVRTIYYMRTVMRPLFVELGLFVAALLYIGFLVSIPNVIANTLSQGILHSISYLLSAFLHTRVLVQVMFAGTLILLILMVRDILKNFAHQFTSVVYTTRRSL
jgi:hypothetical protein